MEHVVDGLPGDPTTWSDASESIHRRGAVALGCQHGEHAHRFSSPDRTGWSARRLPAVTTDAMGPEATATTPANSVLAFGARRDRACRVLASCRGARAWRHPYRRRTVMAAEAGNAPPPYPGSG